MAVNAPDDVSGEFVLGRLAFWAGDFASAQEHFIHVMTISTTDSMASGDEEMIRQVAHAYLHALKQPESRRAKPEAAEEPIEVETENLKGIVWRRGVATFEMRGYLTNLDREHHLRDRFSELCRTQRWSGEGKFSDALSLRNLLWVAGEAPLVVVHVGTLGLITAHGNWCQMPGHADEIRKVFQEILSQLDPPREQVDWKREGL